jgi:hypothetical protein
VVGSVFVALGFLLGLRPLSDNSFLTHLATGRLILDQGAVPSADPFSFTAPGAPWVVQSWLVSVLLASLEELAGPGAIRVAVGVAGGLLAAALWALARPPAERAGGNLLGRTGLVGVALVAGAGFWVERPLLVGLLGTALVLVALEGRVAAWWLVPLGWIWVNSHGSFPLGLLLVLAAAVGARLDGRSPRRELVVGAWLAAGLVLGVIGPLGLQALLFPVHLLGRVELLAHVVEWRAPTFDTWAQRAFLVLVALLFLGLARAPSFRYGLPAVGFVAMALLSVRNVPLAVLVCLPAIARGLPPFGRLQDRTRARVGAVAVAAVVALAALGAVAQLGVAHYRLEQRYPLEALAWLGRQGGPAPDERHVLPDFAGNLLTLLHGAEGRVFFDDRFDMYPAELMEDYVALNAASPGWRSVLDRWDVNRVTWPADRPLGPLLVESAQWQVVYLDEHWVQAVRR